MMLDARTCFKVCEGVVLNFVFYGAEWHSMLGVQRIELHGGSEKAEAKAREIREAARRVGIIVDIGFKPYQQDNRA